jgi:hypothetical protein
MWTVVLWKILILGNLRKMNVIVVELCCMCKKCGESGDHHLLLHCKVATKLWSVPFQLFLCCLGYVLKGKLEGENWETVILSKYGGWLHCV